MIGEQKFFAPVKEGADGGGGRRRKRSVARVYEERLRTEEYDEAQDSLREVEAVLRWRESGNASPFRDFYRLAENMRTVGTAKCSIEERETMRKEMLLVMGDRATRMSPRVADMYLGILASLQDEEYVPRFEEVGAEIDKLKREGGFDAIFSVDTTWEVRANRMERQLEGYLRGCRMRDRRDGKEMDLSEEAREERKERLAEIPPVPPARQNESRPGVDAMERLKEGERAPAWWNITPAYGGYFRAQSFSRWNESKKTWAEPEYAYTDVVLVPLLDASKQTKERFNVAMRATVFVNQWVSLPIPYTHDIAGVEAGEKHVSVKKDQNGDVVFFVAGTDGDQTEVQVFLAPVTEKIYSGKPVVPEMETMFSDGTEAVIAKLRDERQGNLARARKLASYVRNHVRYLAPKDAAEAARYNNAYRSDSRGFAAAVDELRAADCDVANTYFAALCTRLDIPVRHVVGHSVKGKDTLMGASQIHSGTGHAWSEVWDEMERMWIRIDATSAGDPQLEDERDPKGESVPGDYGSQEAVEPSDEQLAKIRQELEERVEKLSYTKAEQKLSEDTGIDLKEARKIVKEIDAAEEARLPDGRRIADALAQLFDMIVESRMHFTEEYTGPLRRRDGGEHIDDIVRHYIGTVSGESDPLSRAKEIKKKEEEKLIGGFDVYLIGDKSGSMSETVDDEEKWKMQRRALYLILSALHRFEEKLKRSGIQADDGRALSVRTEALSFRGGAAEDIDTDKPLSDRFESADKVRLWHSLTEQGSGNGDVAALQMIHQEIDEEIKVAGAQGKKENRLRIVIAMTDGYPDSVSGVHQMVEELGKQGSVVVGVGLTKTAKAVEDIYTTPWSRGDYAETIDDLPAMVAKYVILEAMRLFPEKAQAENRVVFEAMLREFEKRKK